MKITRRSFLQMLGVAPIAAKAASLSAGTQDSKIAFKEYEAGNDRFEPDGFGASWDEDEEVMTITSVYQAAWAQIDKTVREEVGDGLMEPDRVVRDALRLLNDNLERQ